MYKTLIWFWSFRLHIYANLAHRNEQYDDMRTQLPKNRWYRCQSHDNENSLSPPLAAADRIAATPSQVMCSRDQDLHPTMLARHFDTTPSKSKPAFSYGHITNIPIAAWGITIFLLGFSIPVLLLKAIRKCPIHVSNTLSLKGASGLQAYDHCWGFTCQTSDVTMIDVTGVSRNFNHLRLFNEEWPLGLKGQHIHEISQLGYRLFNGPKLY